MKLLTRFKQWRCKHVFFLYQLGKRKDDGKVSWSCGKCKKQFELDYGLQAPGNIVGPCFKDEA